MINRDSVRAHIQWVHDKAAASIAGLGAPPLVIQLLSMAPDDKHMRAPCAFNIGDVLHMTEAALIDNDAGANVYIEPRLVRPGRPDSRCRGTLEETMAVFAIVGDSDTDTGKPFNAVVPASGIIATSPGNGHHWYPFAKAIAAGPAQQLGRLLRDRCGGDGCSGNCVQPFRIGGSINYPNQKKIERGRIPVTTRIAHLTNKTYQASMLWDLWAAIEPQPKPRKRITVASTAVAHSASYSRMRAKMALAAETGTDRSAQFFSAINHAVRGGMSPEMFEQLAREHPNGCAGKYLEDRDRLAEEIARGFDKVRSEA